MKFVNIAQIKTFFKQFRSRSCGLISTAAFVFFLSSLCILPTYAAETDSLTGGESSAILEEINVSDVNVLPSDSSAFRTVQSITIDGQPIAVYVVPDPYQVETSAMIGDVYEGSYSSTTLDYLSGFVPSMCDYVTYRSGQYTYQLYYGTGFSVNGRNISGSGSSVTYNSYSQTVSFSENVDFNVSTSNAAYVYSNLDGYSDYTGLREVSDSAFQSIILLAIFLSDILRWIWK